MALIKREGARNVPLTSESIIGVGNKSKINAVADAGTTVTGTLALWGQIGNSAWIDLVQPFDIATESNVITSITGGPYSNIKIIPTITSGKTETQTDFVFNVTGVTQSDFAFLTTAVTQSDFVFALTGSTITTTAGDFSVFSAGDKIKITGTTNNNGTFTVSGTPTTTVITVVEALVNETPAVPNTIQTDEITTTLGDFSVFTSGEAVTVSGTASNNGVYTTLAAGSATTLFVAETLTNETLTTPATIQSSEITTSAGNFSGTGFVNGDVITVSGTTFNNGTYTINSAPTATVITVSGTIVNETPGTSVSITSYGDATAYNVNISVE